MIDRQSVVAAVFPESVAGARGQTHAPSEVFTGPGALARAVRSGSDWIWLLAAGAEPRADALATLLDAAGAAGEPAPALLAGDVRDPAGRRVGRDLPPGDPLDPDIVDAVARRMLPIRYAPFANCLIERSCFVRYGLPDAARFGRYADEQWSAEVLREAPGYYVPASVVTLVRQRTRREALRAIPVLTRMVRSGAWTRGDALANVNWCIRDALAPNAGGPQ